MDNNIKYYPLSLGQGIMYVSQKYCSKKSVVDICTMLCFECEIEKDIMLKAVTMAMDRNESSRVRLHKVGKEIMQYISEEAAKPIIELDYTEKTEAELEADLEKWSKTPFPNKSMDTQLYTIRFIKQPNGFYALYFCVSHLAFDAFALMYIASDMLNIYCALRDGTEISEKKGDYIALLEKELEYKNSDKFKKTLDYWKDEVFNTKPKFTTLEPTKMKRDKKDPDFGKNFSLFNSNAYHVNCILEKEVVDKVNALAEKMHISPLCIYLLAIRSYLGKMNDNQEDITFANSVARRSTLLEKTSGGTRVLAFPARMVFPNSMTASEALNEISGLQKVWYRHTGALITDIAECVYDRYKMSKLSTFLPLATTFNPYGVSVPEGMKVRMRTFSNGANSMAMYLSIMALDNSGDLVFNYDCLKVKTTPETAKRMHAHIEKVLKAVVEDQSMTLLDLNNL